MVVEDNTFIMNGPKPAEPLPTECIGKFVIDSLLNNPTDQVMVCAHTGNTICFKQILQDSCDLAEALRKYGCNEDTNIALCSENHLKYFIPLLANLFVGSATVPINPAYSIDELKHIMYLTRPKIVFCSLFAVKKFLQYRKDFSFVEKIITIDSLPIAGVVKMDQFVKYQIGERSVDPKTFQPFNGNPAEHTAVILTSSGTTGLPKGVMVTDQNVQIRILHSRDPTYIAGAVSNNVVLGLLPFFHAFGFITGIICLCNKRKLIVMKKFDDDLFLKTIQDYKMEVLFLAPPLAVFLAKSPKVDKYDLSCVKHMGIGAAPLKKETELNLKARLKNINSIRQGYGLTECLVATLGSFGTKDKEGSAGQVATFASIKVRDAETGRSLGPNKVGELCIKGPLVMKGYYKNEEATRDSFTSDGWLKTGDLGYYDEEGYFYIVDRIKELIKYKAFQVAPAELEALLLNHPKIMDVGVVGLPDEEAGELPIAFVVRKSGFNVTEREIQDYVAEKVSSHKRLRGGVIFVPEIPKNPSGKILRRVLRNMLTLHSIQRGSKL